MKYTIYKTTNLLNDKIYIGQHKTEDPNDSYLGSGKLLLRAINKYGQHNFVKEVIHIFDNPVDMYNKEAQIVTEEFLNRHDVYNLKVGGEGGWDYINENKPTGWKHINSQHPEKRPNVIQFLDKMQNNAEFKNKMLNTLKIASDESKFLIENDEEHRANFSTNVSKGIKLAIQEGRFMTDEHRKSISEAVSKAQSGEGNSQYGTMWISNIKLRESKKIIKGSPIPPGYVQGYNKWNQLCQKEGCELFRSGGSIHCEEHLEFNEDRTWKKEKKQQFYQNKYSEIKPLYDIFKEYGFEKMVELTGYIKSKQSFHNDLRKYIPEHNYKKRK